MENKIIQIKNKFDKATIRKIIKSSLIAGGGALAISVLTWFTSLDFGQLTGVAVAIAAVLINAIKEYRTEG